MFAWQNMPARRTEPAGPRASAPSRWRTRSAQVRPDALMLTEERRRPRRRTSNTATDLFDATPIDALVGHFGKPCWRHGRRDDSQAIARAAAAPAAERHQLLVRLERHRGRLSPRPCVHELFEAQAARTPEADAVVFDGEPLTYAELNAGPTSWRITCAAWASAPSHWSAICLERSLELVVALLAILKAGGAYVPLDPAYPADAARPTCWPTRRRRAADPERLGRPAAADGGAVLCLDASCRRSPAQPDDQHPHARSAAASGLRHLHLRLHRPAQGRDDRTPALVNLCAGCGRRV